MVLTGPFALIAKNVRTTRVLTYRRSGRGGVLSQCVTLTVLGRTRRAGTSPRAAGDSIVDDGGVAGGERPGGELLAGKSAPRLGEAGAQRMVGE